MQFYSFSSAANRKQGQHDSGATSEQAKTYSGWESRIQHSLNDVMMSQRRRDSYSRSKNNIGAAETRRCQGFN